MGGATRAIERGFQQREIHEAAYRWQKQVESGDAVVVGVNRFTAGDEVKPPILRVDASAESARRERWLNGAAAATARAVDAALAPRRRSGAHRRQRDAARSSRAVESHATLGEIADRFRAVFGSHRETFAF